MHVNQPAEIDQSGRSSGSIKGSMTGPQAKYLRDLCVAAGVDFDVTLTKTVGYQRVAEFKRILRRGEFYESKK